MMKKVWIVLFVCTAWCGLQAQETGVYQVPPKEIADMLLAKPTPAVRVDSKGT